MAARVVKIVKTLRTHWKKSTVAAILTGWGVYFLQDRIRANILRGEFCRKAIVYGQESIKYATEKPRKVTVILNPAARKGKGKTLFEKNAAPILNLAGIDVEIIKTESEGNGKEKARLLEDTDAVVVAGGDGTIGEVITGLLRRDDEAIVSLRWPLGVIPVGGTNSLARFLYADAESDVRWMGNAAMAIIRGVTEPVDVMAIKGEDGRQIFTVNNLEWGKLQETRERATKYWYFGPLKWRWAYMLATLRNAWPPVFQAEIRHRPPLPEPEPNPEASAEPSISWLSRLLGLLTWRTAPTQEKHELVAHTTEEISLEQDVEWTENKLVTVELVVTTSKTDEVTQSPKALSLKTGPANLTRKDFIKEGWRRLGSHEDNKVIDYETNIATVGEVTIMPLLKEGEESWYSVDNDRLEAQPITVRLLPRKLHFFTDRHERDKLIGGLQNT